MLVERMLPVACKKLVTIGDDAPLIDAAKLLDRKEANLVVVRDSAGALAGVIAKTDIVRQIGHCQGYSCTTAASAVMTRDVAFCSPHDFIKDVWSTMKERGLKHIPVIDRNSRPVGLLIARDVLGVLLAEVEYEEQLLRDYVMCIGYH
jgi:CBS domain-containing protein